jgi:hypothetical protein
MTTIVHPRAIATNESNDLEEQGTVTNVAVPVLCQEFCIVFAEARRAA